MGKPGRQELTMELKLKSRSKNLCQSLKKRSRRWILPTITGESLPLPTRTLQEDGRLKQNIPFPERSCPITGSLLITEICIPQEWGSWGNCLKRRFLQNCKAKLPPGRLQILPLKRFRHCTT